MALDSPRQRLWKDLLSALAAAIFIAIAILCIIYGAEFLGIVASIATLVSVSHPIFRSAYRALRFRRTKPSSDQTSDVRSAFVSMSPSQTRLRRPERLLASAGVAAVIVLTVAVARSCASGDSSVRHDTALAIVVGAHANDPPPVLVGRVLSNFQDAVLRRRSVSVVINSGHPLPLITSYSRNCLDSFDCRQAATSLKSKIENATATAGDNDLLAAIDMAAREVSDQPGSTIDVVDSGLQTVDPLNFHQDPTLILADPNDIAQYLRQSGELPDLKGLTVVLSGIGDTAPLQAPLNIKQRNKLIVIWSAICHAAGAKVMLEQIPLTGDSRPGLPLVPTVAVPSFPSTKSAKPSSRLVTTDEELGFVPDTATFVDPAAAQRTLAAVAIEARKLKGTLILTGTTATVGSKSAQLDESIARAQAVANLLIQLGVPRSRITVRGVGATGATHVPDIDSSGRLLPVPAAENRKVIIELPSS
jgi:OmpA-OmpF porin, OOP family